MILYDWATVFTHAKGDSSEVLNIIAYLTFKPLAKDNYDIRIKNYAEINWKGISFLLNPKQIFIHRKKFREYELAEYVALASFRNYNEYKVTKQTTLSAYECPISLESLQNNRLLTVQNNLIYFCWEEATH